MSADGLYCPKRAPAYERIAGIEGQSNFLSLLAGIEAGPDTTQIMGALSFSRLSGGLPEVLEAHVSKSTLYRLPLMSVAFMAVVREYGPAEKEWPWVQGAIADAFMLLREGKCKPVKDRSRQFRVDVLAYAAMRKVAARIFDDLLSSARANYYRANRSMPESPGSRHTENERGTTFSEMARMGNYRAGPLPLSDGSSDPYGEDDDGDSDYRGIPPGVRDRLGYDGRNEGAGPVLELHGAEAEAHCLAFPSQTNRPHSL